MRWSPCDQNSSGPSSNCNTASGPHSGTFAGLTRSTRLGAIAAILIICDGTTFVAPRTGMLDILQAMIVIAVFGWLTISSGCPAGGHSAPVGRQLIGMVPIGVVVGAGEPPAGSTVTANVSPP